MYFYVSYSIAYIGTYILFTHFAQSVGPDHFIIDLIALDHIVTDVPVVLFKGADSGSPGRSRA